MFNIQNCIKFYVFFEENGKEYFVYEIATGGTLASLRLRQPKRRFDEVSAKRMISMIAQSLSEMHKRNVIHVDIKPENLMLSEHNSDAIIKLANFEKAR